MRVIVDLDGTLCDHRHRVSAAIDGRWDEYHAGIPDDAVHSDVADVIRVFWENGYDIIACTGRPVAYLGKTMEWLLRHNIPVDSFVMRPEGDFRPDHQVKPERLADHLGLASPEELASAGMITVILDDRDKVVEAWRNLGLPCWQVRMGDV